MSAQITIRPYSPDDLDGILDTTLRAWEPVFPKMRRAIPGYVYDAFYPEGWKARQIADVTATCEDNETEIWIAELSRAMTGFVGLRAHPEDRMGEIYIIAVDPDHQRQGIAKALMDFAFEWMKARKLEMAMVETGDDAGHAPSRQTYESAGFERYPVARYFRKL